ncbi:hypothetical protein SUGI_0384450 [Cryptomeria japonica]|nr:hypothetical protein SUGI_0384450 [Cryptomeria japonica]
MLPPKGCLKMNSNGASRENFGLSRASFIVRSDTGGLIWRGCVKLPNDTNNDAKYASLVGGLRLCKERNILNIDIEGDSLNVIQNISFENAPSWKSRMWVNDIQEILEGTNFSTKCVFHEEKREAFFLSNHVIN